jgi:tetratricopeptide (TPR) repeat protein
MIDSQLLDRAYAPRDEAKYREAYELFILAANQADNLLEKAGILLNAPTNLTQSNEQERSRSLLSQIRVLVAKMNPSALSEAEQDEFMGITVGIEIEEAEVLVAEGKTEAAVEQLSAILERFKDAIKEPKRIDIYDEIQSRRAYCLSDLGFCDRAIPALEEIRNRRKDDRIFLFYLGHCYFRTNRLNEAQQMLERALVLGPRPRIEFQAHGTLGMVFYESGDYRKAKQELETCVTLAPPD